MMTVQTFSWNSCEAKENDLTNYIDPDIIYQIPKVESLQITAPYNCAYLRKYMRSLFSNSNYNYPSVHPDSLETSVVRVNELYRKKVPGSMRNEIKTRFLLLKIEVINPIETTSFKIVETICQENSLEFFFSKYCLSDSGSLYHSLLFSTSNRTDNRLTFREYENLEKLLKGEEVQIKTTADYLTPIIPQFQGCFSSDTITYILRSDDLIHERALEEERLNFALIQHNSAFTNIETAKKTYTLFKTFISI